MTVALVLGGSPDLAKDVEAYKGPVDAVIACNEAGFWWKGNLKAWVSLHPEYFQKWSTERKARGYRTTEILASHRSLTPPIPEPPLGLVTKPNFKGQPLGGSSGLFAAKVALQDLGYRHCVLAGIPLLEGYDHFRSPWLEVPAKHLNRMRSMSGWTRGLLGRPEWTTHNHYDQLHGEPKC